MGRCDASLARFRFGPQHLLSARPLACATHARDRWVVGVIWPRTHSPCPCAQTRGFLLASCLRPRATSPCPFSLPGSRFQVGYRLRVRQP